MAAFKSGVLFLFLFVYVSLRGGRADRVIATIQRFSSLSFGVLEFTPVRRCRYERKKMNEM